MASVLNDVPCGGKDNIGEGCQEIYPRSTSLLCQKCQKLSAPGLSDSDIETIKKYASCASCGLCGLNVANPCGTCRRKDLSEKGEVDSFKEAAAVERHARVHQSFGTFKVPALPSRSVGATTPLAELEASKSSTIKGNWTIIYQVRKQSASSVDKSLGFGTLTFPSDTTLPDVLQSLVDNINVQWIKLPNHTVDLKYSECELRLFGNFTLHQEASTLTIKDFYTFYLNRTERALLDPADKKIKLPKGTFLCFEVYIYDKQYKARLADLDEDEEIQFIGANIGSKRSSNKASSKDQTKRRRSGTITASGPLTSTYALDVATTSAPVIIKTVLISFTILNCAIDTITGSPKLSETATPTTGYLQKKTLDLAPGNKGLSKDVHQLTIDGRQTQYVAKRFMKHIIGDDQRKNRRLLMAELVRIMRLASFKDKFVEKATRSGVEFAEFQISDAFMIIIKSDHDSESIADSYLVEPLRASTEVTKYSGTMAASNKKDKMSATISAFAHFIAAETACKLVFVDLQGSLDYKPGGKQKMVLFDPMTHSPFKATGLGDFGLEGIENFIENHGCSATCKSLLLPNMDSLQEALKDREDEVASKGDIGEGDGLDEFSILKEADGEKDMDLESEF